MSVDLLLDPYYLTLLLTALYALWVGAFFAVGADNVGYKARLWTTGFIHLFFSSDKKFSVSKEIDPDAIKHLTDVEKKTLVFIRHGESEWNEVFNKGFGPSFPVRLLKAIVREWRLLVTGDSVFVDSNLSDEGADQAVALRKFLADPKNAAEPGVQLINGAGKLYCSNLRRSMATTGICLSDRLQRTGEKVQMMTCLQEVTFNIDGLALADANTLPALAHPAEFARVVPDPAAVFTTKHNVGNKPLRGTGLTRMKQFAEYCFNKDTPDTLIVGGGHSLWFRFFFQVFMPKSSDHISKKKKLVNCGACSLTLTRGKHQGKWVYRIEPESVEVIYGGFGGK